MAENSTSKIRVRLAPSPTGVIHVGTARTALFNWLFARKHKGVFIIRIEDTDYKRSKREFELSILKGLAWLGLDWDEGPVLEHDKTGTEEEKGSFGPYHQSQRTARYKRRLKEIFDAGKAFYCFHAQSKKDKHRYGSAFAAHICEHKKLSHKEQLIRKNKGEPYVIRFAVPERKVVFHDLIRGRIEIEPEAIGDFSIARSEDSPLYNLAVAVDDIEMEISHVIRGEDHISNTPKQILIQEALGKRPPKFAHLPLLLGEDRSKLSKRHGAVDLAYYQKQGYLPEAFFNFLALLGWNPGNDQELFYSKSELIDAFSLAGIQKGGAIFNVEKLDWMNNQYIRLLSPRELASQCIPYLERAGLIKQRQENAYEMPERKIRVSRQWLENLVQSQQERLRKLKEITELTRFYFVKNLDYEPKLLIWKKADQGTTVSVLKDLLNGFAELRDKEFNSKNIKTILEKLAKKYRDRGTVYWPLRVALSGREFSPPPIEIAAFLGKDETITRLNKAISNW